MRKATLMLAALLALLVGPAVAQLVPIKPVVAAPSNTETQASSNAGKVEVWMVPDLAREEILKLRATNRDLKLKVNDSELQSGEAYRRLVALTDKTGADVRAYCASRDVSRSTAGAEEACNRFSCNPGTGTCNRSCTVSLDCAANYSCEVSSGVCRLQSEMSGPDE